VTAGGIPVDFPDPSTVGWDIDFNPAVDRLRVVTGSLNFRVLPNTGLGVDGDAVNAGIQPDGPISGGTTTVSATAYTNNQPNNGGITTQYTLDGASNSLYIQNPPNIGTQTLGVTVTLGGNPLDFTTLVGFDIASGVNVPSSNAPVTSGSGFALMTVGGTTGLYSINLVNAQAAFLGAVPNGRSIAIRQELGAAIALSAAGNALLRFSTVTPGTVTTQALNLAAVVAGETLVGIDCRPQTGQFYTLGVNATANTGTLYLFDPQTGVVAIAVAGTASAITFAGVDFPDPTVAGYGMDFNPTVDRIRVVTSSGLNFRINPNTGLPAAATPDGAITGLPGGSTGVSATAYTNSYGQSLTGGVTTQYTLDAASNSLYIQNPPNNGTQTVPLPVTLGGNPLDFTDLNGFDIPGAVAVTVSNTAAAGDGWFVATVGGVTGLYRLNLTTGAATFAGNIGAGATPLTGLTVFITPVVSPNTSTGLLTALNGDIVGSATVTLSAKGVATVKLVGGTVKATTKISVPTVGISGANFTPLGYVTLERQINGTIEISLTALGGDIGGTLLPVQKTATAAKYHIALASIDLAIPGGGYAIAKVSKKGAVKITGLLPDGVPFSAASALRDNNTIAFYTVVKGPKPPAIVGGELTVADLANTDIAGQLSWLKRPQLPGVKGLHLGLVDTVMNAQGSIYDGTSPLPSGNGTLKLSGGDLTVNQSNAVAVSTAGIPEVPTGALQTWTGVKVKVGKFTAKVTVPAFTKPVKGSGLYLPKSNRAWGFFPGKTVGGRIELTVP
jgi:hypothetical protein